MSDQFYKALLDSLFDAVFTVDCQRVITYWNESCERLTGHTAAEMIGQPLRQTSFMCGDEKETEPRRTCHGVEIVLETGMPGTWKGYLRRKNGQRTPIDAHISAIRDEQGRIMGAVAVFRDMSAHVALEDAHRQLLHLSRRDQLTGLYNRVAITELLRAEIERSRRYRQPLSIVLADIDHFKRINDRYGHEAGDRVLAQIGAVLRHNTRKPDEVGRWGGEEFLVIAPAADDRAAGHLADRLRGYIEDIPLGEMPEKMTASFGVAQLGGKQTHDQLLYMADMALYEAKRTGRNRVVLGLAADLGAGG